MGKIDERIERLSVLLEAERAGVSAARFLVEKSTEEDGSCSKRTTHPALPHNAPRTAR